MRASFPFHVFPRACLVAIAFVATSWAHVSVAQEEGGRIAILDADETDAGQQPRRKIGTWLSSARDFEITDAGEFWLVAARHSLAARDFREGERRETKQGRFAEVARELDLRAIFAIDVFEDGSTVQLIVIGRNGEEVADIRRRVESARLDESHAEEMGTEALKRLELIDGGRSEESGEGTEGGAGDEEEAPTSEAETTSDDAGGESFGGDDFGNEQMDFAPTGETVEPEINFTGKFEGEQYTYLREFEGEPNGRAGVSAELEVTGSLGDASTTVSTLLRRDLIDGGRNRTSLNEAYVQLDGSFKFVGGKKIVNWGTANLFNPTDVINIRDARYPMESEKRGAWMVALGYLFGDTLVKGYVLPAPQANIINLPDVENDVEFATNWRWVVEPRPIENPEPSRLEVVRTGPPEASLESLQYAVRTETTLFNVDLALGYVYRFDPVATLEADIERNTATFNPQPVVTIRQIYPRTHMGLFSFQTATGGLRIAGEAASVVRTHEENNATATIEANDTPYLTWVGGADYRFPQFAGNQRIHAFLEVTRTHSLDGEELPDTPIANQRYPVDFGILSRLSYEIAPVFTFSTTLIEGLSPGIDPSETFLRLETDFFLLSKVHVITGVDFFQGEEGTTFDAFERNTRAYLKLSAQF